MLNPHTSIILWGPPKSGKTTLGKKIAERLGWSFVDTDRLIEEKTGVSCREFFRVNGENVFREFESQEIKNLEKSEFGRVIAVGGGAVLDPANVSHLKSLGVFIYLKTPMSIVCERMSKESKVNEQDQTPAYLANRKSFEELMAERECYYQSYEKISDYVITNSQDIEDLIQWVLSDRYSKIDNFRSINTY